MTDTEATRTPSPWFSDRALHVIMGAYQTAAGRGHDDVGTRHLLLALLYDEGCTAHRVLTSLGVTYQVVDDRVGCLTMEMCPSYPWIDSGTKQALVSALREASRLGHELAGTGHILRGVLDDTHGSGPHVLRLSGVAADLVRRQPLLAEDPAPLPYPLPVFGKTPAGRRELAYLDGLFAWCKQGFDDENGL